MKNLSLLQTGSYRKQSLAQAALRVVCLSLVLVVLQSGAALASTSSWSGQPSWATGSSSKKYPAVRGMQSEGRDNISPFSPDSHNVAVDIGQVFLMGDLGKYTDNIGFRGHYTYGVSELFAFDASLGYSSHSDGSFSMITALSGLRMNFAWYDRVIPYAVFGMGFYRPNYKITAAESISPLLFGLHLGPGVDLQLSREMFFGAALTFHDMFGTTRLATTGPVEVGGTFTTFLVHAGMTF